MLCFDNKNAHKTTWLIVPMYLGGLVHHIKCGQDIFVETIYVDKSRPCVVLNQAERWSFNEQNLCDLQLFNGPNVHR